MTPNAAAPPPQRCPVCDQVVSTFIDLAGRVRVEIHQPAPHSPKRCPGSLMVPKGESDPMRHP